MLFPNWTGWKTIKLALGVIGTAAGAVATANQGTAIGNAASIVATADAALLSVVVMLSGTAMGPTVSK